MHRTALLFAAIVFVLTAAASYFTSATAVTYLERQTEEKVRVALHAAGQDWALIEADGLKVVLTGVAPDEPQRLRAMEIMAKLIDADRIDDQASVLKPADLQVPRFSLEVLRNERRVSLIGLVPRETGRTGILDLLREKNREAEVTDMLETADYPVPQGWEPALRYALDSLQKMPRSKISVTPEVIRITAVTDSVDDQKELTEALKAAAPKNIQLVLDISAPRPVISPFRFLLALDGDKVELTACSADTPYNRGRILDAIKAAGHQGEPTCKVGLGIPTTDWTDAVILAVEALHDLGSGTLTFTDTEISLIAGEDIGQDRFDTIAGKLENGLPELFSLLAVLPPKPIVEGTEGTAEVPEFVATKSPEGLLQMRGRVPDDLIKQSVNSFAAALFGHDVVFDQTLVSENLPEGWPVRVLAGLEGLSYLNSGILVVQPENISISGVSGNREARAEVSRVLTDKIDGKGDYRLNVKFDQRLAPVDLTVSPEQCEARISEILAKEQIAFAPSSSDIEAESLPVISDIAEVLRDCADVEFIIEGHTDSQGGEEMNKNLSQTRAESVLSALLARRVLTSGITAIGYGEERPIGDNDTEEGRAANRRIEFHLVSKEVSNE
jgi:OOP family OmpA-OmpF porin